MARRKKVVYQEAAYIHVERRRYGCFSFLFDAFMTVISGGLWLIWIFVREMRNR